MGDGEGALASWAANPGAFFDRCLYGHPELRTPAGLRVPLVQADMTASGLPCRLVSRAVERSVYPMYANTHGSGAAAAFMESRMRYARAQVRLYLSAEPDHQVLFTGSGTTAAVNHFIHLAAVGPGDAVVLTALEHNSNFLPWRESGARIVAAVAPSPPSGRIDPADVEAAVASALGSGARRAFVAIQQASNVTGVFQHVQAIADAVARHAGRAFLFVDCAASAPYDPLVMVPFGPDRNKMPSDRVHAVAFSPHKLLGGVESPGVLLVHRSVCLSSAPYQKGGGTVYMATSKRAGYLDSAEDRESAGTPDIVGAIRIGMALEIQLALLPFIAAADECLCGLLADFSAAWAGALRPVGAPHARPVQKPRAPILSFTVRSGSGAPVHPGLVVALLNDLFGVQARAGASCAGLLAESELPPGDADGAWDSIEGGRGAPAWYGWVRVTMHYTMTAGVAAYVLGAVAAVAAWAQGCTAPDHAAAAGYEYAPEANEFRRGSGRSAQTGRIWSRGELDPALVPLAERGPRGWAPRYGSLEDLHARAPHSAPLEACLARGREALKGFNGRR